MKHFLTNLYLYLLCTLSFLGCLTHRSFAQNVQGILTTGNRSHELADFSLAFQDGQGSGNELITVNDQQQEQVIDGFGFALTQGSAEAIMSLPENKQLTLLEEFFGPEQGNNTVVRISIGASDLSNSTYSYNEIDGDVNMDHFSFQGPDAQYLLPVLKKIKLIQPSVKLLATPWTAPTWMKTNRAWIGGSLASNYYAAYANYFVKYLQLMKQEGLEVWAITPQNEPENPWNEPSMLMNAQQQLDFIDHHLGPKLAAHQLDTKIIAFDHNCDNTSYPISVLNGSSYVDGAAFHLYGGDISAMSTVHNATNKNVYFTEQYTDVAGDFSADLKWHTQNIVVGSLRNYAKTVIEWNLASFADHGPRTPGGCTECLGAVTIQDGQYQRNVSYYIIHQISTMVNAGARIVHSSSQDSQLSNVGAINPDGTKALLVHNGHSQAKTIRVVWGNKHFSYILEGNSVASFKWDGDTDQEEIIRDAFVQNESEQYDQQQGTQLEACSDVGGGQNVGYLDEGDFLYYKKMDFANGAASVALRYANNSEDGKWVDFRTGSDHGPVVGSVELKPTGSWQSWQTVEASVVVEGVQDLYLTFRGGSSIGNLNWFQFHTSEVTIPAPISPSNFQVVSQTSSSLSLVWDHTQADAFLLQYRELGGSWQSVDLGGSLSTHKINGLPHSTTYELRIRTERNGLNSAWAPQIQASTLQAPVAGTIPDGLYAFISKQSGKAIDVSDRSLQDGAGIQQWEYSQNSNQQWEVSQQADGHYKIIAHHSGKALDVRDGGIGYGNQLQQWADSYNENQQWDIQAEGDFVTLLAVKSGRFIGPQANENGANIILGPATISDQVLFTLVPVEENLRIGLAESNPVVISPNPIRGQKITLTNLSHGLNQYILFDQHGREVTQGCLLTGEREIFLRSPLAAGMYYLQIHHKRSVITLKLIAI